MVRRRWSLCKHCQVLIVIVWSFLTKMSESTNVANTPTTGFEEKKYNHDVPNSNCYAIAVYNELMRAIDILNAHATVEGGELSPSRKPSLKQPKLQEDEDEGGGGGDEFIPPIVPMVFKVIGSALSLNSSALTESTLGIIPDRLSSQITSVLGGIASSIFGSSVIPKTTRPPRRRRRTTTAPPTTTEPSTTPEVSTENSTETTEAASNTTEKLFHESLLGSLPVYASAYAPNYNIPTTTQYPIYASLFTNYSAAQTTPTTTTTTTTTSTTTTTLNPNSYGVLLPFDYQEFTTQRFIPFIPNTTAILDYEEYEYEGEEASAAGGTAKNTNRLFDSNEKALLKTLDTSSSRSRPEGGKVKNVDEDEEYLDQDSKVNRSLGRIAKASVEVYKIT